MREMKYICPECGNEIPEDAYFCYHCGREKKGAVVIDDKGNVTAGTNTCANCGQPIGPSDIFCQHCGQPITREQVGTMTNIGIMPKMAKNSWVAIILALIPGFFNIFGLGHLWFKRYARAAMYLCMSMPLFYLSYISVPTGFMHTFVFMLSILIYFGQAMEVFTLCYMPPKNNTKKKE
jgi:uncharacterized OB-fold protein